MKLNFSLILILFFFCIFSGYAQDQTYVLVKPKIYEHALRNPLKGFTTRGINDHPWASTAHTYIRWNELENNETDGIEKIIRVSNQKWGNIASKNKKVIPRVYLHWDGDKKYWPADMQTDDYTSDQFKTRVLRLIKRLGICWDNDPRVAFIELGIFGKWGEHHSPAPTAEMQKLVGDAFAEAFKNKKVSVRINWNEFTQHPFGEYWDSWAHYDQMWGHGNSIKKLNNEANRYKENYVGGEVAYDWGNSDIQPGPSPTSSVAVQQHRNFIINTIRWLHCTQLRWIDDYDKYNTDAIQGAEEIQKAFGYRYVLNEVRFSLDDSLKVSFDVTNTGSAPFYYNWPVEVALLDSVTHEPVWKAKMESVDIRNWMPGEGWTDPDWKYVGSWQEYLPDENWNTSGITAWSTPPDTNTVEGTFKPDVPDGTYILSLSILDPAGDLPSIKFATANYLKGAKHPMGLVKVGENKCDTLPSDFQFDNPISDNSLYYDDDFEVVYTRDPKQTFFGENQWRFPADTVQAWQYDFMNDFSGEKYFSLDSGYTIGVYGCNDTAGVNIRLYNDSVEYKDAAQFKWNETAGTFQKNGQWLEYTANFQLNLPYQLLLRARNNVDANFSLSILTTGGDTVFSKIFNLATDFKNLGGGNENTNWFLSKIPLTGLWGLYTVRFDWFDNIGEPGIFGDFSFSKSELDTSPPDWYYISLGTFSPGTNIIAMTTEDATIYLVPEGTLPDTASIKAAAVSVTAAKAFQQAKLNTQNVNQGNYVLFAVDSSGNISAASQIIKLQYPVNANKLFVDSDIKIVYNTATKILKITSSNQLYKTEIYNVLGKKVDSKNCIGKTCYFLTSQFISGIYLVRVFEQNRTLTTKKVVVN